jgi:hypothetical protein
MRRSLRARIASVVGVAALAAGVTVMAAGIAGADTASDDRADFHDGNVTTCEAAGFPDSTQVGAEGNGSASDSNVSGVVGTNNGPIHTGEGEELNVTILGSSVQIDAVVVKGGNGYNVYSDQTFLPPTLGPPQHYISPFNNGGNVPTISHWFICYSASEGPTEGALEISKTVIPPVDPTAVVPTSFTVHVDCDSADYDVEVTESTPATITGLPDGDTCVVTETSDLPVGSGPPVYDPATASTDGVEITADTTVSVGITNDFSAVEGEKVVKPVTPVTPAAPVVAPATFTG